MNIPLFKNLRQGNWLLDYMYDRLSKGTSNLKKVADNINEVFSLIK